MDRRDRIVVDWGSSNFRAYRFGSDGAILDRHQAEAGILAVTGKRFEDMLEQQIGGWITAQSEILLSGMITSRNGWFETPYIACPAPLSAIAAAAQSKTASNGAVLRFLPGVSTRAPTPDVMRGEEIQVFGSIGPRESATLVLPGTHSKWVEVEDGAIAGFRTFLTGELFALLRRHSVIGRLIPPETEEFDESAFLSGVIQAQDKTSIGLLNDVFTARSGALLDVFPPQEIADRLSGILVGHELKAGLSLHTRGERPIRLVGERNLTQRYRRALAQLGHDAEIASEHAAIEGFRRLSLLEPHP